MWRNQIVELDDIIVEMDKNLHKIAFENKTSKINNRLEALELLNKAAEKFEKADLIKEADAVVRIMEFAKEERLVAKLAKKAQIEPEIDIEESETPEEKALYELLMSDPNVALEVSIDEKGEEETEIPTKEMLKAMW